MTSRSLLKIGIHKYSEHVREMFEMTKLLPPTSRKNEEYCESAWDTRGVPFKYYIICKAIKDSLPEAVQEKVEENYHPTIV